MSQLKYAFNRLAYETTLKALQARTNGKLNSSSSTAILSLMALGLTGCGGSGTVAPSFTSGGTAVKGPLSNATVFIDLDGDGQLDSGELSTTTSSNGSYSFATDDQSLLQGDIIVKTNENTIDASSGETLDGLTLTATEGSTVVSPATTLIKTLLDADTSGTLTLADVEADVQAALGISADVDLSTFNPFAADADLAAAKEVEAVAQQIVAIVNTVAAAAEAAGADKEVALTAAIEELADQLDAAATGSTTVDLTSTAAINDVITAVDTATSTTTDASVVTAISSVNTAIDTAVTSATTLDDARETFAIAQSTLTEAAQATVTGDTYIATQLGSTTDPAQLKTIAAGAISISGNKASVTESDEAITATGSLTLSDPDSTDAITYRVKEGSATLLGSNNLLGGTLTVDADGNWTYNLDVTGDATKLALLQELQTKSYQGDLATDSGTPALANFQIIERFEVQIEKVDATADADNPTVTDATYADTTPIKKVITVVINGTNDAVAATAEGAAISDVTDAAQGTAITNIDTSQYFTDKEVDAGDTTGGASGAGDKLTFTAAGLPEGLSINADTGVISGTPSENTLGAYDIVVTATDIAGTSATQSFTLTVANVNDAPVVSAATADTTTNEDAAFTLNASLAFTDADTQFIGDADNSLEDEVLTYTATLADDSALPSWLSIDSATGVLSGTPANGDVGTISVKVTATDVYNASVSDTFDITVANTNDAPTASEKTGVTLGDLNTLTVNAAYVADQTDDDDFTSTDNEVLKVTSVTVVSGGGTVAETSAGSGSWTYTPPDVSEDTAVVLKYIVSDVAGATASANIGINVVDAIPLGTIAEDNTIDVDTMLTNAAAELGVAANTLSLALSASPDTDLSGTYDPGADFNGSVSFVIKQSGVDDLPAVLTVTQVNDTATGTVTISGTVAEDSVLTATNDIADVDGLGTLQYQWKADDVAIDGADSTTLTLGQDQVGKTISVDVSFTDGDGNTESKTASTSTTVANVNDLPTGSVTISDTTPTEDQTLTVSNDLGDEDGLGTISYQWYADGSAITGATESSLALTDETLVGKAITVTASYTDGEGTPETKTSAATTVVANVNDAPVADDITTIVLGDSLTLTLNKAFFAQYISDDDANSDYSITGITVSGSGEITGTTDNFVYNPADVTQDTDVTLTYTVNDGAGGTDTGDIAVRVVDAIPLGSTNEDTTKALSDMLSSAATALNVDVSTLSLALASDPNTILSADYSPASNFNGNIEFVIKQTGVADLPALLTVNQVNDDATGDVTISGTATEDQVLTAVTDTIADVDGLGTFNYVWKANGSAISGATESTLTLGQAQVGTTITVDVSFTDEDGNAESFTSIATGTVANVNDDPTGAVTISGALEDGATLTAVTSAIADEDGLGTFSYQWQADGADISGATSETFVISRDLIGSVISVDVDYTDGQNTAESLSSADSAAVVGTASSYVVQGVVVDNGSNNYTVTFSLNSDNAENIDSIFGYSLNFDIVGASATSDPAVTQVSIIGDKRAVATDLFDGGDLVDYYAQQFTPSIGGDPFTSDTPWAISGAGALALVTSLDTYTEGGDLTGIELTDFIGSNAEIMSLNFTVDNDVTDFDLVVSGTVSDGSSSSETIVDLVLDIV